MAGHKSEAVDLAQGTGYTWARMAARPAVVKTDDPQSDNTLATIGEVARSVLPGAQILLFGSHARDQASPDSDYDILIITDRPAGLVMFSGMERSACFRNPVSSLGQMLHCVRHDNHRRRPRHEGGLSSKLVSS